MAKLFNLLTSELTTEEILEEITTTSNVFLDESGQFEEPGKVVQNISDWWTELDLAGKIVDKLPTIILAAVVIVAGLLIAKAVSLLITKAMQTRNVDPTVYNFITRFASALIKAFSVMTAVSMFFDLSSFIAALGGVGLAAGLGLQSSVSQFASGIQILLNHPFKTGDYVEVNGVAGNVADIRFMNTVINTPDNKRIIIPNSHITSNHIINYSAEENRLINLTYSIGYDEDISRAKSVILSVALDNELVLKDPEPTVFVNSHEGSAVCLIAKIWVKSPDYWTVFYRMQEDVKLAFDENSIEIPYNQIDVHIDNN